MDLGFDDSFIWILIGVVAIIVLLGNRKCEEAQEKKEEGLCEQKDNNHKEELVYINRSKRKHGSVRYTV